MKKDIHPKYLDAVITCACGEVIHTRSTKKEVKVGVCSKCHPFFTGTQKFMDTAGRVEKFMKKYAGVKQPKKKKVRRAEVAAKAAPAPGAETKGKAAAEAPVTEPRETAPVAPVTASQEASPPAAPAAPAPAPVAPPAENEVSPPPAPEPSPVEGEAEPTTTS